MTPRAIQTKSDRLSEFKAWLVGQLYSCEPGAQDQLIGELCDAHWKGQLDGTGLGHRFESDGALTPRQRKAKRVMREATARATAGMARCVRCGSLANVVMMSKFNTEMICAAGSDNCMDKERAHPDYAAARKAELAAINRGAMNFPGIGKPKDL